MEDSSPDSAKTDPELTPREQRKALLRQQLSKINERERKDDLASKIVFGAEFKTFLLSNRLSAEAWLATLPDRKPMRLRDHTFFTALAKSVVKAHAGLNMPTIKPPLPKPDRESKPAPV